MKRSEMVSIITENLLQILSNPKGVGFQDKEVRLDMTLKEILENGKAVSEVLLDIVEGNGMIPPFYHSPFDRSLGESSVYVENYKWEPEDGQS